MACVEHKDTLISNYIKYICTLQIECKNCLMTFSESSYLRTHSQYPCLKIDIDNPSVCPGCKEDFETTIKRRRHEVSCPTAKSILAELVASKVTFMKILVLKIMIAI